MRRQTYGYLPSRKASPPIGWYQIILLGDRGTCVITTCPGLHSTAGQEQDTVLHGAQKKVSCNYFWKLQQKLVNICRSYHKNKSGPFFPRSKNSCTLTETFFNSFFMEFHFPSLSLTVTFSSFSMKWRKHRNEDRT